MTGTLATHGQGGNCYENPGSQAAYHNSFLICDRSEAWVLETAGKHWAAEHITSERTSINLPNKKHFPDYLGGQRGCCVILPH